MGPFQTACHDVMTCAHLRMCFLLPILLRKMDPTPAAASKGDIRIPDVNIPDIDLSEDLVSSRGEGLSSPYKEPVGPPSIKQRRTIPRKMVNLATQTVKYTYAE